jgi:hypothetical protein
LLLPQVSEVTAMLIGSLCTSRRWPQCQRALVVNSESALESPFLHKLTWSKERNTADVASLISLSSKVLIITGS